MACRTIAMVLLFSMPCAATEITVAAAADLQFALREIAANYEKQSGNTVKLTFGSSGALAAQIQNGAPFDVFFSADESYPEMLVKTKAADAATLRAYAKGMLVLWVSNEVHHPDLNRMVGPYGGFTMLVGHDIRKIAIANPQHAPYGRAAVEALRKAAVYDEVAPKFVTGENVSQAAQFAESGNAQAALLPLSLAMSPELAKRGQYVAIPQEFYRPIVQVAVITTRAANAGAAKEFLRYVLTRGTEILRKYGFAAEDADRFLAPVVP